MADNRATISGAGYLLRWLAGKPSKAAEKATRQGVMKGAKRVLQVQKASAPIRTKLLWKSLGYKIKKYGPVYVAIIGVRRGFKVLVKDIQKKRVLAVATRTVKTKGKTEIRTREIKLLAAPGVRKNQYINPTRYAHIVEKRKRFVGRSVQRVEKEVQEAIAQGLRGELR